jgi:hypothetical protein
MSVTKAQDWLTDVAGFHGEWQGGAHGSQICIIAYRIEGVGGGPKLDTHPYAEVFVIRVGRGCYVGNKVIEAAAGEILVVPAFAPHKVENLGPARSKRSKSTRTALRYHVARIVTSPRAAPARLSEYRIHG